MNHPSLPEQLRSSLQKPLPGVEAQYRMAHVSRKYAVSPPSIVNRAAVMALLYPRLDEWFMVFILRKSNNARDRHRGQIGFPGGRYEETDADLSVTARRETEEEVGVYMTDIELLGSLTDLYIPVSNFLVSPFVGKLNYAPDFVPQESEVGEILEVPFRQLADPTIVKQTDMTVGEGITLNQVPYFDLQGKVLWGATAMMVSELLEVYRPASLQPSAG